MTHAQTIDQAKLEAFVGQGVTDFGTMLSAALVVLGDKLGLWRAMAGTGPLTSHELAARTGTAERYVRDWLLNQAAAGYVAYDPASERYAQAIALTNEASPFFLIGAFQASAAVVKGMDRIVEAFRSGEGVRWGEHDPDLFTGTERLFRPGYQANLVASWIPALDGVAERLEAGGRVADVGCGHGTSTIVMAQAYPRARFVGFDTHAPSIARAQQLAVEAGVSDRVEFLVAGAGEYPGTSYDLICFFDCLHHMDAVVALGHAREALAAGGTILVVEPMAGEQVEENFTPVGRAYSGFSVLCFAPDGVAACGHEQALGTIATEARLRELAAQAGLAHFRRATETPLNRVFALRR
jgi:SAM-dependent methyltransferase